MKGVVKYLQKSYNVIEREICGKSIDWRSNK